MQLFEPLCFGKNSETRAFGHDVVAVDTLQYLRLMCTAYSPPCKNDKPVRTCASTCNTLKVARAKQRPTPILQNGCFEPFEEDERWNNGKPCDNDALFSSNPSECEAELPPVRANLVAQCDAKTSNAEESARCQLAFVRKYARECIDVKEILATKPKDPVLGIFFFLLIFLFFFFLFFPFFSLVFQL